MDGVRCLVPTVLSESDRMNETDVQVLRFEHYRQPMVAILAATAILEH